MQDNGKIKQGELMQFIRWMADNPYKWDSITEVEELNEEEQLKILKSLYDHELHVLFLLVLQKHRHRRSTNNIINKVMWEFVENAVDYEMIKQIEANIIQKLKQAQTNQQNMC